MFWQMNEPLLHLIALWSGCFLSRRGPVVVLPGMRNKMIELLESMPSTYEGVGGLSRQAMVLNENEIIGIGHPLNQAMFVFMLKHEAEFSEEHEANLRHIKSFFNGSRISGFKI
jgi:hypothetical protein